MRLIYTIGIRLYTIGIRMAAFFGHKKARLMVKGWNGVYAALGKLSRYKPTVWFHAASLGEFEQARPVLEAYRQRHPDCQVLVTFFSPSGYEVRKNYAQADAVCYLPMDTPSNVRRFVKKVNPDEVFFVKYEFWYNYLNALREHDAKTYIFSAIFRPEQYFFRPWGVWYLQQLRHCFTHLFVQNEESLRLLKSHGIYNCSIAGDTRFDRVHQIALAAESDPVAEQFLGGHTGPVLVAGSTWPPDEQLLAQIKNDKLKIILAPHLIDEDHLRQIETLFPGSIRYSAIKSHKGNKSSRVLVVDNIGLLSKLYRYATVAYIGGGFGVGIHNTLEAVTFGKPVLFGPKYHKFQEAHDLIARGGGFSHADGAELEQHLKTLLSHPDALAAASQACLNYMRENLGSTDTILNHIEK